jgi:riboflavin kinase/FMN adenylyltransferase
VRPTVEDAGRVLLEVHALDWPAPLAAGSGYGRCVRVELLHKLRDEQRFASVDALREAIANDAARARAWFSAHAG